jgi:hypothetical protein
MAFSAVTGKSVRLSDGQLQTHVVVTNDANGNTFEDDLSYQPGATLAETQDNLEARVRAAIDLAKRIAQAKQVPLLAVGTVLDLTVPVVLVIPPTPPTQLEIDKAAWSNLDAIRRNYEWHADRGYIPANDPRIAQARTNAIAAFQPGFLV